MDLIWLGAVLVLITGPCLLIREYQRGGQPVARTGDGTNDTPALSQADVAVAMNTGTQAAKEAGNMVNLDSNPGMEQVGVVEPGSFLAPVAHSMKPSCLRRCWHRLARWMMEVPPNPLIWYAPQDWPKQEAEPDRGHQDKDDQERQGDDERSIGMNR